MSLDFQRLEQVLAEAAAQADPAERAAYLAQACGEDRNCARRWSGCWQRMRKPGISWSTPVQQCAR